MSDIKNGNPVNTNPSPKEVFLAHPKAILSRHVEMVSSEAFALAKDTALAEYQRLLCNQPANELGMCASLHLKMIGAQEFLATLLHLHVNAPTPNRFVQQTNLGTNQPRK